MISPAGGLLSYQIKWCRAISSTLLYVICMYYCRSFSLHLESRVNLFSPKFQVHLVTGSGLHEPFFLNTNRFYQGHLIGQYNG